MPYFANSENENIVKTLCDPTLFPTELTLNFDDIINRKRPTVEQKYQNFRLRRAGIYDPGIYGNLKSAKPGARGCRTQT